MESLLRLAYIRKVITLLAFGEIASCRRTASIVIGIQGSFVRLRARILFICPVIDGHLHCFQFSHVFIDRPPPNIPVCASRADGQGRIGPNTDHSHFI